MQTRMAEGGGGPPARERVFSAEVVALTPGVETPVLTAFGEIRSRRTLELRAPAEGQVVELAPRGSRMAARWRRATSCCGSTRRMRRRACAARTDLRDAENELAEARRALDLAIEDVAAARRQAELRARALARQTDLLDRGVGSAAAVEDAELAAATAEQAVLSRRQAEAQAEARATDAETALERAASRWPRRSGNWPRRP
jgi:hypothetical protein